MMKAIYGVIQPEPENASWEIILDNALRQVEGGQALGNVLCYFRNVILA